MRDVEQASTIPQMQRQGRSARILSAAGVERLACALVMGFALLFAAPAVAQKKGGLPSGSEPLAEIGAARPIPGWVKFCDTHPSECRLDRSEDAVLRLTPRLWQAIVSVNQRVNATLEPLTDLEHWGIGDQWSLPADGAGDCEDYQLLKRKLLVEQGLPARALRMTVVLDDTGEGHAVLMVRTDRGDFVLDNKVAGVLPWHQTGYTFVKREGSESAEWVSLGHATTPVATANR